MRACVMRVCTRLRVCVYTCHACMRVCRARVRVMTCVCVSRALGCSIGSWVILYDILFRLHN